MQKNNPRLQKALMLFMVMVTVFSMLSCNFVSSLSQVSTATPTAEDATATAIKTATATLTAMATALPTNTPTAISTATQTPTMRPTATPDGFYKQSNAGYSLTYPSNWTIQDERNQQLVLADESSKTMLVFFSFPEKTALKDNELKDQVQKEMGSQYTIKVQKTDQVEWADQVKSTRIETICQNTKGGFILWVYYAHTGNRGYMVFAMGDETISMHQKSINAILSTLHIFKPVLYDLPHEKTLTMMGGIPDNQSLDPATTSASAADYVGLIFSGLVRLAPDMQVVPELADHWEISSDGKVYTFTLRSGLKFASGGPITAQDVKDSWERAADPKTKSTTASTYLGDIAGLKDKLDGKAKDVSGIQVIDEKTLKVTLDGPKPYFLAKLTYPTAFVVDNRQPKLNGTNWVFSANSSGPYKIYKYYEEEAITFEVNSNYWKQAEIPYLIYLFRSGGSVTSLYDEGTIDMVYPPATELGQIKQSSTLSKELVTMPSMCSSMIMLNPAQAPLDDPLVRKALWLATDRSALSEKLSQSTDIVDDSILPPAMPGYQASRKIGSFDPVAAKAALSQSKYAGKAIQLTITASGYANNQPLGITLLVDMWKKNLGIDVKVEFLDPETYNDAALKKKDTQVMMYGWCADYPDPENFLDVLFHSDSQFNLWHLNLPELDALLEKARTETDPTKRLADYQQAEDMLLQNYDVIPEGHDVLSILVKPRVKHFVLAPMHASIVPLLTLDNTAQ